MASDVESVGQTATFRQHIYVSRSAVTEWKAQDCGISKAVEDTSMLSSKIIQIKESQENNLWTCHGAFLP